MAFRKPAPCVSVHVRIFLRGVQERFHRIRCECRKRLQHQRDVPVTTGAAMLVPLNAGDRLPVITVPAADCALTCKTRMDGQRDRAVARRNRSAWRQSRNVGPRELKPAIAVVAVDPLVLDAPTSAPMVRCPAPKSRRAEFGRLRCG